MAMRASKGAVDLASVEADADAGVAGARDSWVRSVVEAPSRSPELDPRDVVAVDCTCEAE